MIKIRNHKLPSIYMCVCVCVCVCELTFEREGGRRRQNTKVAGEEWWLEESSQIEIKLWAISSNVKKLIHFLLQKLCSRQRRWLVGSNEFLTLPCKVFFFLGTQILHILLPCSFFLTGRRRRWVRCHKQINLQSLLGS
jgi:hypothetical protein